MGSVRLLLVESPSELRYDVVEREAKVRRSVADGELLALSFRVKNEADLEFTGPGPLSATEEAVFRASEAAALQLQKEPKASFFPFMSSFVADQPGKKKDAASNSAARDAGRDVAERRRAAWEQWLVSAYENVAVAERSDSFLEFVAGETTRAMNGEDATVARAARRRRLVAEAKGAEEHKGREALKAKLRSREGEVASEIGSLEVRAAQLSRNIAGLRARRQALGDFVESRLTWREARAERREASLAQVARLEEELAATLAGAELARDRAALAKDKWDAEAACGAARREAAERTCGAAAATQRAAQEELAAIEERATRSRGRLGQRAAEAEAASQEADRAAEARQRLEQVELPKCESERSAAAARRKDAEDALAAHRREAATRAGRLGLELARRQDERLAVEQLVRHLDIKDDADLAHRLGQEEELPPPPQIEDADKASSDDAETKKEPSDRGFEQGAVHVFPGHPSTDDQTSSRRLRLIDAYASAVAAVERSLDTARRQDSGTTSTLQADLEAARAAELALGRVLTGALERGVALRESSRRADRAAASAQAAKDAARRELEEIARLETIAIANLSNAETALDEASRTVRSAATHTSTAEKNLRHAHDADAHVATRQLSAANTEADALAVARGRLLDDVPVAPKGPPDALDLATHELFAVETLISAHEADKARVRRDIASVNSDWETESVAMRAKLHGAECQLRIFRDDASAALRMQRDLQDTVST